jgi:hypothetical protein
MARRKISESESVVSWARDYLEARHPELVRPVLAAAEAFDRACASGELQPDDLRAVASVARDRRSLVAEYGASLLGALAAQFETARTEILSMSTDSKAHVRISALIALIELDPSDTHVSVALRALKDKSAKVRLLAADKVLTWRLASLIPALEEALLAEQDIAQREQLDLVISLLRDGYKIVPQGDAIDVYVQPSNGGIRVLSVSENELRTKGIEGVALRAGIRWVRPAVLPQLGPTVA